jgi:polysaccharide export outer membrane protein
MLAPAPSIAPRSLRTAPPRTRVRRLSNNGGGKRRRSLPTAPAVRPRIMDCAANHDNGGAVCVRAARRQRRYRARDIGTHLSSNRSGVAHLRMRAAVLAGAALAGLTLVGCSLPTDGPRGEAIERTASIRAVSESKPLPYCLVPVTPLVTDIAGHHIERLAGRFSDRTGPVRVQTGTGDVVSVTLFESAAGGLFFPLEGGLRTGNFLTLPNQVVDEKGDITVPYAGAIRARGRTAQEIQQAIVDALKDRALEPQAVVTVVERHYAMVTVLGTAPPTAVTGGTFTGGAAGGGTNRIPASLSGERVLDTIARAGGLTGTPQDTWVMINRDQKIAIAPFEALAYEPANNIFIQPQDVIFLYREPQTFLAFGATGRQAQVPFDSWRLSLAEALAKAGGLLDDHAEPRWVFLFRAERQKVAQELDPRCAVTDGQYVPVIYELDLRDPASMFLATQFPMRNKDVIYVSNARAVEETKFINYVRLINGALTDPINTALSAYALKAAIKGTASASVLVGGVGVVP